MSERNLVLLPVYNREAIIEIMLNLISSAIDDKTDILVVDDGSDDDTEKLIKTSQEIKYLKHESPLGYGICLIHGIEFAVSYDYKNIAVLDITCKNAPVILDSIIGTLEDGNDIVNCSRVKINETGEVKDYSVYSFKNMVSAKVNNITGHNLSDVFSPFKGFKTAVVKKMTLEEYDEAMLIQFWIQAAYFGCRIKEIFPPEIAEKESIDDVFFEKEPGYYLDFIDSEKYLYPVNKTN